MDLVLKEDINRIFICPHCLSKFQAGISKSPKAYRCPICRNPFTIYPDGDIQKEDRTKPRQTIEQIRPPSVAFSEDAGRSKGPSVGPASKGTMDEEKKLYTEVLDQFKELSSRQKSLDEASSQVLEIKRVRKENEKLRGDVFTLEERLKAMVEVKDYPTIGPIELNELATNLKKVTEENNHLLSVLEQQRKQIGENERCISEMAKEMDALKLRLRDMGTGWDEGQSSSSLAVNQVPEEDLEKLGKAEIEAERDRLSSWREDLDAYKARLEEIAISLVKERDDIDARFKEVRLAEEHREDLGKRERDLLERERALLEKEDDMKIRKGNLEQTEEMLSYFSERNVQLGEKETLLSQRESNTKRTEDRQMRRSVELEEMEQLLSKKEEELLTKEIDLREKEKSIMERQASLEKAREKLRELKERMQRELGSEKRYEDARSRQRELKEKIESKQVGIKEMETKLKDLLQ